MVFAAHALPHVGGVELYLDGLLRRLASRDWDLTLVTSDVGGGVADERLSGIRVLRLACAPLMAGRLPVPLPGPALLRVVRTLEAISPKRVVTNTRFQPLSWLGTWFARSRSLPQLHIEHGSGHVPMNGRIASWISRTLDRTAGRWVVRSARRQLGVSTACAAFLRTLGASDPGVLFSGVDPIPRPSAEGHRWRSQLGMSAGDVAITYVGRVTEDKGVPLLLEAFRRVTEGPRTHLVIAGGGPALESIRARAATVPRAHVVGPVPPAEIAGLLGGSDVFAHPSLCAEGLPRAVLEAASAGLPIVATPQGGTSEVIRSPEEGLLVAPGDVSALATALTRLASDASLRMALGEAVRRSVSERFGWDRIASQAEVAIRSLGDG